MTPRRFSPKALAAFEATKYLRLRSGPDHRFVAVWCVVVDGRVFVRSWNDKPTGWRAAFLQEPQGAVQLDGQEVPLRARPLETTSLDVAIAAAYAAKYTTKANRPYVKGLCDARRRATTMELLPA